MTQYYFVGALLPDLRIGEPPDLGFRAFDQLLHDNLSDSDYAKTSTLRNFYDIGNLRAYLKGEPFDLAGNLSESGMEEALITRTTLPRYIFRFLDHYETDEERLRHFPEVLSLFFQEELPRASGKFRAYLQLEQDFRLILTALRAKKAGRDITPELQYEDPENILVADILAQRDAPQYEPPEKYEDLKEIFEKNYDHPLDLQREIDEYRFRKIDELCGTSPFSLDRILMYMVQLIIVEKWSRMDHKKGTEIIESMLKEPS